MSEMDITQRLLVHARLHRGMPSSQMALDAVAEIERLRGTRAVRPVFSVTAPQHRVLEFVRDYIAEHQGIGPSFEEIMEGTGYASKCSIHRILSNLEKRGYIERVKHAARAIRVLPDAHA